MANITKSLSRVSSSLAFKREFITATRSLYWNSYLTVMPKNGKVVASGRSMHSVSSKLACQQKPVVKVEKKHQLVGIALSDNGSFANLEVEGANRTVESRFSATWLRYNCHCSQCKQPHSGQKMLDPSTTEAAYHLSSTSIEGSTVKLQWHEDQHSGSIPVDFLLSNSYSPESRLRNFQRATPPYCKNNGDVQWFQYNDLMSSHTTLLKWLQALNEYGLCMVTDVPTEQKMVCKVAEKIANVQKTIYGEVFDVVSTDKPINVAYSNASLIYHMDLMYYESPPGLQFLHCLRFDDVVEGGENFFADSWWVAEDLRKKRPQDFDVLSRVPATFQKVHFDRDHPVCMTYQRPHIVVGPQQQVTAINWSPPFEGPLAVCEADVGPYYAAYTTFAQMLNDSSRKISLRLKPGQLVAFNNRRIVHARSSFILNGGMRHLQGCYVNIDEFKSVAAVMSRKMGNGNIRRVFNQCLF